MNDNMIVDTENTTPAPQGDAASAKMVTPTNGAEIVGTVKTAPVIQHESAVGKAVDKLDGNQVLAGTCMLVVAWLATYVVACVTGHDISIGHDGFFSKKV